MGGDSEERERSNIVDSKHDFFILILIIKENSRVWLICSVIARSRVRTCVRVCDIVE